MDKEKMSGSNSTEWADAIKERLRWYMEEATDEEFDEDEVSTLVNLLNKMNSLEKVEVQNDEEELARFHEYVKMREAEEAERSIQKKQAENEVVYTKADKLVKSKKHHKGISSIVKAHKFVAIAAAALLIVLVAGGSLGAVNANQGNGFFYWLEKDKEGITMLTSPEDLDGSKKVDYPEEYASIEEVPEEYQPFLINNDEIDLLQDYEIKCITINEADDYCRIKQWFVNESNQEKVFVGAWIYEEDINLTRESHLSKDVQVIENEAGIEEGVLLRENPIGMDEGKIFFYVTNIKYFVEGNVETETLIQIAEVYRDIMLN